MLATLKSRGSVDARPYRSSFIAIGDDNLRLPLKAGVRGGIGNRAGERVAVHLGERVG